MLSKLAIICAVAVTGLSADSSLNGLWVGEVQGDSGAQTIQMSIHMDGERLGASIMSEGREIGVYDGTFTGNTVKFYTLMGSEAVTKFNWIGQINGDEIAFTYSTEDQQAPAVEFVVHRQP
jgi:hypothetical protein